jgi:hypothetical protein
MRNGYWIVSLAVAAFTVAGCEDADYQSYNEAPLSEAAAHGHDHDHGEVGRYGGHVLELDDAHAHHGELVFDAQTRDVTVYFYGGEVGVAKAASKVTLGLHVADGHKDILAKPIPLEGETDETASRWVFSGADLPENVTSEEQLDGHLEATIDGKPFSYGLEPHSHGDHDESDHAEHSDAEHAHEEAKAK